MSAPTPASEKQDLEHAENYSYSNDNVEANNFHNDVDHGFDPVILKKLMRKIDIRLIPILSAMYCISLIDRTNLSLARAANNLAMQEFLQLGVGERYR
jgi:hypothetical protein